MAVAGKHSGHIWEFLDRGLFRELGVPALVVSVVLFVSAMTLLGASVSELRGSYARVQRANEALLQISMVNSDILRIEMTMRGYALSGDSNYMRWLKESRNAVQTRLAGLEKLVSYDAEQRGDVAVLKNLVESHGDYFTNMAKRVSTDRGAVIAEMVDYSKKVKRRPIEDLLQDMRGDQMQLLAAEQREAEQRVISAYRYAIGISSLALLFGAFGFALILHDRRAVRQRFG